MPTYIFIQNSCVKDKMVLICLFILHYISQSFTCYFTRNVFSILLNINMTYCLSLLSPKVQVMMSWSSCHPTRRRMMKPFYVTLMFKKPRSFICLGQFLTFQPMISFRTRAPKCSREQNLWHVTHFKCTLAPELLLLPL